MKDDIIRDKYASDGMRIRKFGADEIAQLSDIDLTSLIIALNAEQSRRSLEGAEIGALIEEGFNKGFQEKEGALEPWLVQGILVAPGIKIEKSGSSHTCSFVRVDQRWVWEANDKVEDVIRYLPGARTEMRSITLVATPEGAKIDRIRSKARNGVHKLVEVRSYVVRGDELELVSARAIGSTMHR